MLPSGGELLLILVAILLLFGGRDLPKIMRTMGRYTAMARRAINDVRQEFNRMTIQEELKEAAKELKDTSSEKRPIKLPKTSVEEPADEAKSEPPAEAKPTYGPPGFADRESSAEEHGRMAAPPGEEMDRDRQGDGRVARGGVEGETSGQDGEESGKA